MCGILGWVGHRRPDDTERFERALNLLSHRGPDDHGIWETPEVILGHRRLSILDLSKAGHQPMVDSGSENVIVFNGEIFNYVELRNELNKDGVSCVGNSDTEVLLKLLVRQGESALPILNGMWSFSYWDSSRRKLFFARDRFGVKPFYFIHKQDSFVFASEPKALLELFPEHRVVCEEALFDFLAKGMLLANGKSFYSGLEVLPPAHCGFYDADNRSLKIWRYWDYPECNITDGNPSAAAEEFASLLDDAVRIRLRSDVPVGVTLSGGLDSTAVLAGSMNDLNAGQRICFTSVYSGSERGEATWAATAARPYGITPVEVEAPQEEWLSTLQNIAWHMDGPGYSPAVYPLWCLMKEARKRGVPVLLEGQGADEELGGYPQYAILDFMVHARDAVLHPSRIPALMRMWRRLTDTFTTRWASLWLLRESFPFLVDLNRCRGGAAATLRPEFIARAMTTATSTSEQNIPSYENGMMARLLLDHSRNILPGLLHYGDAISMAHSVEARLPFMDYRIVEWAFRRGPSLKIREGHTKWVLREYLRSKGQDVIASRVDKQGYPTPAEQWLANHNGAIARDILLSRNARIQAFCAPAAIERLIEQNLKGRPGAGNHLYRLVSTEMWLQASRAA